MSNSPLPPKCCTYFPNSLQCHISSVIYHPCFLLCKHASSCIFWLTQGVHLHVRIRPWSQGIHTSQLTERLFTPDNQPALATCKMPTTRAPRIWSLFWNMSSRVVSPDRNERYWPWAKLRIPHERIHLPVQATWKTTPWLIKNGTHCRKIIAFHSMWSWCVVFIN